MIKSNDKNKKENFKESSKQKDQTKQENCFSTKWKRNYKMMQNKITSGSYGEFMVFPNDAIGRTLIDQKKFEPHFMEVASVVVKPGDFVVDCGANLGLHTVSLGKLVGKGGMVLAIEPLRVIYQQLCGNVFLNNLHNIITVNVAVGNENKNIQMEPLVIDGAQINIGGTKVGSGGEYVEMVTLDSMNLSKVSFIKIDVQGNETNLINGALKLIQDSRPIMFVEVEDNWLRCFGTSAEELMNKIISLDYVLLRVKTEYPCDHIAIPKEKNHMIDKIIKALSYPVDIIDGQITLDFNGSIRPDIIYNTYKSINQKELTLV